MPPIGGLSRHRGGQDARCLSSARTGITIRGTSEPLFAKFHAEFSIFTKFRHGDVFNPSSRYPNWSIKEENPIPGKEIMISISNRSQSCYADIRWRITRIFLCLWIWCTSANRKVAVAWDRSVRPYERQRPSPSPSPTKIQVCICFTCAA